MEINTSESITALTGVDNIYSAILIGFVAVLVFLYFTKEKWGKWIAKKNTNIDKRKFSDLVSHRLFYKFPDTLDKVKSMKFITYGEFDFVKTESLHILIECQLSTLVIAVKKLLTDESNNDLNENELESKIIGLNSKITEVYNDMAMKKLKQRFPQVKEEHFVLLIESYMKFRADFHVDLEAQMISVIKDSQFTSYENVRALLEVLQTSLFSIPAYIVVAMNDFNGTFFEYNKK